MPEPISHPPPARLLAVDSATPSLSAAIVDGPNLLAGITLVRGETHSRHLMTVIDKLIDLSGTGLADLDGFAVTKGPGSFTGLRIAISTLKGLALAVGKPLVGISSLEALALQGGDTPYLICPLLDARKKEVYFGRYQYQNGRPVQTGEDGVGPISAALKGIDKEALFLGNGVPLYKEFLMQTLGPKAHFMPPFLNTIQATAVAQLARLKLARDPDPDVCEPYYIRKSDAETAAKYSPNPSPVANRPG